MTEEATFFLAEYPPPRAAPAHSLPRLEECHGRLLVTYPPEDWSRVLANETN